MGTISTEASIGTITDSVRVTFQTNGEHKQLKDGKKFTQAMVSLEGLAGVVQLSQWGEHVDGWKIGESKELKLKEAQARDGLRCFTVLTGSGGGAWRGAPARPTWDMSPDQAKNLIFAIWKGQFTAVASDKPDLAPDTVGLIAATLTEKLWESANVAIQPPKEGSAA